MLRELGVWLLLDLFVSFLFFRSWVAALILFAFFPLYLKERRRTMEEERRERIRGEFLTGIQLFGTALQAGYSAENAAVEAVRELEKIYEPETFIVSAFRRLCARLELNVPIERLFFEMGALSGVDDIQSFAEVFAVARRSGGDLSAIVRNTISVIRMKEETRASITTVLSGRQMEQNMMSLIPLLILAYVGATGGSLLTPMYETIAGRLVMAACLVIYALAFVWGKRIMRIRV